MWKKLSIFITSLVVGFLITNQFQAYKEAQEIFTRDTSLSYVEQVNLLVDTNYQLKAEIDTQKQYLGNIKSSADANQLILNDINKFEKLAGLVPVQGPGISLEIDLQVEGYWLVDIINELATIGVEAVSINKIRLQNDIGLVTQAEPDYSIYINNQKELGLPYTIEAIGDPNKIYQYLIQENGIINRFENNFVDAKEHVKLEKKETIILL